MRTQIGSCSTDCFQAIKDLSNTNYCCGRIFFFFLQHTMITS